jgi:hypothetical protein
LLVSNMQRTTTHCDRDIDLFGDQIRSGHGARGRPQHVPNDDSRSLVATLAQLGWPQRQIAQAVGITPPTLRLRYRRELDR